MIIIMKKNWRGLLTYKALAIDLNHKTKYDHAIFLVQNYVK